MRSDIHRVPPIPEAPVAAPRPLTLEPLLVDARQAAALCGISLATWYRLKSAGRIGPAPLKLGGRVLYRVEELREWTRAGLPDRRGWEAIKGISANGQPSGTVGR